MIPEAADPVRAKRPWFRRRRIRAVGALVLTPILLFFLSNLWLTLPWGRAWIAGKITARTGLPANIESASWSPWNGIHLGGVVIERPPALHSDKAEPLLKIDSVRAWPVWKSFLQRRPQLSSLEIESPRAVIPLPLLAHFAPRAVPPPPVVASPPVAILPPPPSTQPGGGTTVYSPTLVIPIGPQLAAPAPPVANLPPAQPPLQQDPTKPVAWIHIRNASLAILAEGTGEPAFEATGFHADIPAAGAPADSVIHIAALKSFGSGLIENLDIPLRHEGSVFQIGPAESLLGGVKIRFGGKVAAVPGLPMHMEMEVPGQENAVCQLLGKFTLRASECRGLARFDGYLTTPLSWQGDAFLEGTGCSVNEAGHAVYVFDRVRTLSVLRNGVFSCQEARLIGDNLSLLGNATMISDGRGAAVLRVVAEPSVAAGIANRIAKAGSRVAFGQLGTPDRLATDLSIIGNPDGFRLELGQGGDVIDGPATMRLLKAIGAASL